MKSGFVSTDDGIDLFYEASGSGSLTLLLVPGWTMTTRVFERQLAYFENSDQIRCVTLDPRAHGRSSQAESGHTYENHGRDLQQFIDRLGLENIILAGWSFGTLATLSYVHQFGSDRLTGFIMLDGPPRAAGDDNGSDWVTYCYDDRDRSQEFFTMGKLRDPDTADRAFAEWMLADKTNEAAIEMIIALTRQTPTHVAALLNATAVFLDYRTDLVDLSKKIPLLHYVRAEQRSIVENWSRQHTPSASVCAHGEHMMFWEEPETFNANLSDYLVKFM